MELITTGTLVFFLAVFIFYLVGIVVIFTVIRRGFPLDKMVMAEAVVFLIVSLIIGVAVTLQVVTNRGDSLEFFKLSDRSQDASTS